MDKKEEACKKSMEYIEVIKKIEENMRRDKVANMTLEEKVDFLLEELYIKRGL